MGIHVDPVYISCACNRAPHCVDWGYNNLVCYGTCNAVAIYDPKFCGAGKVMATFCHHKGRVNCVRWIRQTDKSPEKEFISTSSDGTAVIWAQTASSKFIPTAVLGGHQDSVTITDGMYTSSNFSLPTRATIVVTGSVDSTVKVWIRGENSKAFVCVQTIDFGSGFSLCVRLSTLPQSSVCLLACAADDAKVHLFVSNAGECFMKVHTLVGHEDWIQALDITSDSTGDMIIASGSQDTMIRLWRISPRAGVMTHRSVYELAAGEDIQPDEEIFSVGGLHFAVIMESVLAGHEGWVYSVCWCPSTVTESDNSHQPMKLLSSSLDKTMTVWSPDPQTGMWLEVVRVGGVGGNTLGFYGSTFSPDGCSILGHGYQGSFHMWTYSPESDSWNPSVTVGGHFDEVADVQWEPAGQYILSVSKDQTTRLHAPWAQSETQVTWHEMARPQIHGYDISCLAVISSYKFVSGAEEKVIRAFQAPNNFVENFKRLSNVELEIVGSVNVPRGASVPALGLSNKAVYETEEHPKERHTKDEFPAAYFVPVDLKEPPTEEHLMQNTLWPEIQKLYGHGYELFSLAAHPKGTILASACKATTASSAAIILWDTQNWKQLQSLTSHQLTVTQMTFSPDGYFLLSVSRDRQWSLFKETENGSYELYATTDKKTNVHARIIWTCAWSSDSKYFATGSRDGKLGVWEPSAGSPKNLSCLELRDVSITAVAFHPQTINLAYIVAIGLESGVILIYSWLPSTCSWQKLLQLNQNDAHHLAVKRLTFSPKGEPLLASCGADYTVKLHVIHGL